MAWEASSTDVVFPSAELLQSAYEAVRPRLRPEDVPAALTRDVGPGVSTVGAKRSVVLSSSQATSDVSPLVSPCSKTDERSTLTTDLSGPGGFGQQCELANQQALEGQQEWHEQSKHRGTQRKRLSRTARSGVRPSAADAEQRHERVIQHRDRSTTYTLGGPRCSRTDGKHWQCKREALPEQKYCEKHLHRGLLRSRKRKRGDEYQDVEGERLFQGWQRGKPKLWPGLCQSPPLKDGNPSSSQSPPTSQALFSPPSLQLPSTENPPWLAAGPQTVGQWTPAQEQILKATLSELGLEEKEALAGSSSAVRAAVAELSREVLQHAGEDPPWAELQCDPTGPPGPLLQPPQAPNILRVGQDQAVLPPSAQIALAEDGSFLVPIPIACLASVGVSVNADGLVSTWGSGVPIYVALGETSELVKLEALKPDGETVVFKGRPRMQVSAARGTGKVAKSADLSPGGIETAATKPPWDGEICAEDCSVAGSTKGLNLDLNLHAGATETGAPFSSPLDPCDTSAAQNDSGPGFFDQYPPSAMKQGSVAAQDASSPFFGTVDAQAPDTCLGEWLANQWGTGPLLEMLQWGVEERGEITPPADPNGKGSSVCRNSSPSVDVSEVGDASLQRTASLPTGFELESFPPESSPPFPTVLNAARRGQTEGAVALRGPSLGPMGDALLSSVASVILQTPQGVFLGGGGQLDENDTEGSCGGTHPSRGVRRTLSDGQGSQIGPGDNSTDSASSLLRGRKRGREQGLQVGPLMGGWKVGFQDPPRQGCEKGLRTEHGTRVPNTSLSICDIDGVAPGRQRAPGRAAGIATPAESGVTGHRTVGSDARAFELQLLSAAAGMRYGDLRTVGEMQGDKRAGAKENLVDTQETRVGMRMLLPTLGAQEQLALLLAPGKEKVIERQSWELPGLGLGRWTSSAPLKSTPGQESAFGRPKELPGVWNNHRL